MQYRPGRRPPEGINAPIESPINDALFLTGLTIAVVVIAYLVLGEAIDYMAGHLTLDKEVEYFQSDFILDPSKDEKKVQDLVDRLWKHYDDSDKIAIRSSINSSKEVNAFMMIGANLSVTQGLLDKLKSENELAFVVCHEIGHFYNRDVVHGLGRRVGLALALSMVGLGENIEFINTGTTSLSLAFDREQESYADSFALECMRNEYGHVQGYDGFFKIVKKKESKIPKLGRKVLSFAQTHPMTEDRINKLKAFIKKRKMLEKGKLSPL